MYDRDSLDAARATVSRAERRAESAKSIVIRDVKDCEVGDEGGAVPAVNVKLGCAVSPFDQPQT